MIKVDVITGSVMMYIHTMDYDLTANVWLFIYLFINDKRLH